jgi:polyisoprenoid-binding protein YceI
MRRAWKAPAVAWLGVWLVLGPAGALAQGARHYVLVPSQSALKIHVGKTGVFSAFGHEHDVVARAFSGTVTLPAEGGSGAQVSMRFDVRGLQVLAKGEPAGDAPKVQATMHGPEVLDVARFPLITFVSQHVTIQRAGADALKAEVDGSLQLHGVVRPVHVPVEVQLTQGGLRATGQTVLKQTDYGISPVSAGGGTVKVEDEITVSFDLVGRAAE